jgi:hypothetical protein
MLSELDRQEKAPWWRIVFYGTKGLTGDHLHISRGMPNDSDFWLRESKFGYFISRRPLSYEPNSPSQVQPPHAEELQRVVVCPNGGLDHVVLGWLSDVQIVAMIFL